MNSHLLALYVAAVFLAMIEGARGTVSSPADIGAVSPQLRDGADLQRWFADRGAPLVEVWQPA